MPNFNLIDYYKAVNGTSTLVSGEWYINYDKSHAFKIYSDLDIIDEYGDKIVLSPSPTQTSIINEFSSQLDQKLKNTKIILEDDGTERVELSLDDRIVTIIIDQSGSMTWNDNNNFRHSIVEDLINKIENNYPGDIAYNLVEYGGKFVNVLLFGVVEEDVDNSDKNTVDSVLNLDDDENFTGIRVIRNSERYPAAYSPVDGELVSDGFIGKALDENLSEGQDYYYRVYAYDKNLKFSEGRTIKVAPRTRDIPRGVSIFKSFVESDDLIKGIPLIGKGISRDDNTIGIWHFDEGTGSKLFDFSDSNLVLDINGEENIWSENIFTTAGDSALFFDGETNYVRASDSDNKLLVSFNENNNEITIGSWIYPYPKNSDRIIVHRGVDSLTNYSFGVDNNNKLFFTDGVNRITSSSLEVENYKWQYVAISYNESSESPSSANAVFYINKRSEPMSFVSNIYSSNLTNYLSIGNNANNNSYFRGKITEVSVHDIGRSSTYIFSQIEENKIYNSDNEQVDTEYVGLKGDNGDRLVVLKYQIPEDFNYLGGTVRIIRNDKRVPSWEEDGDIIEVDAEVGIYYVANSDDFLLGDTYYYRIYSRNSAGNYSFFSDSSYLEFDIPVAPSNEFFPALVNEIEAPLIPVDDIPLIIAGNRKVYLRWRQSSPLDNKIEKTKIFYSSIDYPVVDKTGGTNGQLVFTGLPTDTRFVHRNLNNNITAYYTIVNVDKYGRSSNYNADGIQVEDFLHAVTTPIIDADEGIIPVIDIENLHYELVDNTSVSIIWDQPQKHPEDIEVFFDQKVVIYASITDQFGTPISEDSPIRMFINSNITRDDQSDDVFSSIQTVDFNDKDAYEFFVDRTDEGLIKATLKITDNPNIVPQIKEASFEIQIKSFVPKEGYIPPSENFVSTDPLEEYATAIEAEISEIEGESVVVEESSENIFEYLSKKMTVKFTNPWEIEVTNRDNAKVSERCYVEEEDKITKEKSLSVVEESFNGIYMKASSPFVARAKLKYKGEVVELGTIDLSVWDADSSRLCANAGAEDSQPYEGEKIQVSTTVLVPSDTLPIVSGEEEQIIDGETVNIPISYVDIPLYAPYVPQAVRLFVKGTNAGYDSVKDIYILFQSVLKIDIQANSPKVDGSEVAEQQAQVFLVDPDYPNYRNNDYDRSLITYPEDNSVVQWESIPIEGNKREIYSIDNVSIPNGIYSYTRNGVARNIFMGPIEKGDKKLEETHEINATIVYNGLSAKARQFVMIEYDPEIYDKFSARFLMENEGGWIGTGVNTRWGGAGWLTPESSIMWADGSDYRKFKIHRNPRIATTFSAGNAFRNCAEQEDSEVLELSSEQIINIKTGDNDIEILYGDITEVTDEYTGRHSLKIEDGGFFANGSADITLNAQTVSDITYFYIRSNKFVPDAGGINPNFLIDEDPINECLDLKPSAGLFKKDLPKWEPTFYISGTTTLFVDDKPLTLTGGGNFYRGIPPCPISLKEPLSVSVVSRQVVQDGNIFDVNNDNFLDENGKTLVKHDSDVIMKVQVSWRGEAVPDDTSVFIEIGNTGPNNLFIASQDTYHTEIEDDGNSYVTVNIVASRVADITTTEAIRIFSRYDENGKTERKRIYIVFLTLDKEDETLDPVVNPTDPIPVTSPVFTPYSDTIERYNILSNSWDTVKSMTESRGNSFSAAINNNLYVIGGLRNNELDISYRNEKYDIINDEWTDVTRMITPRFGGSTIVIGSDIYTVGGIGIDQNSNGEIGVSRSLEKYSTKTDSWTELAPMTIINDGNAFEEKLGVAFGTAQHVVIDGENYIYVLSGINSVVKTENSLDILEYNKRILRYSVENDRWDYSDKLFTDEFLTYARISSLSILYDDKIIVFNGAIENSDGEFIYPLEDFYVNVSSGSLSRTTAKTRYINFGSGLFNVFPEPKYQAAIVKYEIDPSANLADYYVYGGSNNSAVSLNLVEKITTNSPLFNYENSYNSSDDDASQIFLNSMPVAKHGASAVFSYGVIGSEQVPFIYIVGGFTTGREEEFVDIQFEI